MDTENFVNIKATKTARGGGRKQISKSENKHVKLLMFTLGSFSLLLGSRETQATKLSFVALMWFDCIIAMDVVTFSLSQSGSPMQVTRMICLAVFTPDPFHSYKAHKFHYLRYN